MASVPIKMDEGIHRKVKEFVDNSDRFSNYKSFYEDAVREKLEAEKNREFRERNQLSKEEIEAVKEALNQG